MSEQSHLVSTNQSQQGNRLQQFRTLRTGTSSRLSDDTEDDPLAALANLFDVAMVFAVALMVSLISYLQVPALLKDKDYTIITDPGTPEMEIIVKEGQEIKQYEASQSKGTGDIVNPAVCGTIGALKRGDRSPIVPGC